MVHECVLNWPTDHWRVVEKENVPEKAEIRIVVTGKVISNVTIAVEWVTWVASAGVNRHMDPADSAEDPGKNQLNFFLTKSEFCWRSWTKVANPLDPQSYSDLVCLGDQLTKYKEISGKKLIESSQTGNWTMLLSLFSLN